MSFTGVQNPAGSQATSGVVSVSGAVSGVMSVSGAVSGVMSVSGAVSAAITGTVSISGTAGVNQGAASAVAWPVFTSQVVSAAITGTVSVSGAVGVNQGASSAIAWAVALGAASASSGALIGRVSALTNQAVAIKGTSGNVYGFNTYNSNTIGAYIHLYNLPAVSVTVGTTVPNLTIPMGSSQAVNVLAGLPIYFISGIAAAATISPGGATACSTPLMFSVVYI